MNGPFVCFQVAKKASVLRRRKSRAKMGQLGSPTGDGNGNGDFEDNVFEVDEGSGGTGRTGRGIAACSLQDDYRVTLVVDEYLGWVDFIWEFPPADGPQSTQCRTVEHPKS